jgi:hypothetical protein
LHHDQPSRIENPDAGMAEYCKYSQLENDGQPLRNNFHNNRNLLDNGMPFVAD